MYTRLILALLCAAHLGAVPQDDEGVLLPAAPPPPCPTSPGLCPTPDGKGPNLSVGTCITNPGTGDKTCQQCNTGSKDCPANYACVKTPPGAVGRSNVNMYCLPTCSNVGDSCNNPLGGGKGTCALYDGQKICVTDCSGNTSGTYDGQECVGASNLLGSCKGTTCQTCTGTGNCDKAVDINGNNPLKPTQCISNVCTPSDCSTTDPTTCPLGKYCAFDTTAKVNKCKDGCDGPEDCIDTSNGHLKPATCDTTAHTCSYSECDPTKPATCPTLGQYCAKSGDLYKCTPGCDEPKDCAPPAPGVTFPGVCDTTNHVCKPSTCSTTDPKTCPKVGQYCAANGDGTYDCADGCDEPSDCNDPGTLFLPGLCNNKAHTCSYSPCDTTNNKGCGGKDDAATYCVAQTGDLNQCVPGCFDGTQCTSNTCTSHKCTSTTPTPGPGGDKCNPYGDKCADGTYCDPKTRTCKAGCKKDGSACKMGSPAKPGKCKQHKCIASKVKATYKKKAGSSCATNKPNDCGAGLTCVKSHGYAGYCHPLGKVGGPCGKEEYYPTVCPKGSKCRKHKCK